MFRASLEDNFRRLLVPPFRPIWARYDFTDGGVCIAVSLLVLSYSGLCYFRKYHSIRDRCELMGEVNLLDIDIDCGDVMSVGEVRRNSG